MSTKTKAKKATPVARNVKLQRRLVWNENELRCYFQGTYVEARGPLAEKILHAIGSDMGSATLRFFDKAPAYKSGRTTFAIVGRPGGATVVPFHRNNVDRDAVMTANFCEGYAKKLGLRPGQVRYAYVVGADLS